MPEMTVCRDLRIIRRLHDALIFAGGAHEQARQFEIGPMLPRRLRGFAKIDIYACVTEFALRRRQGGVLAQGLSPIASASFKSAPL